MKIANLIPRRLRDLGSHLMSAMMRGCRKRRWRGHRSKLSLFQTQNLVCGEGVEELAGASAVKTRAKSGRSRSGRVRPARPKLTKAARRAMRTSVWTTASTEVLEDRTLLAFNLTIDDATTSGGSFAGGVFTPTGNDAVVNTVDIEALLDAGTSVTINTGGSGAQDGDIQVVAALDKTAGGNAGFTLQAANNIDIASAITSTSGTLGVTLTANNGVTLSDPNADITTGGGTFTVDADSDDNGTGIYSQDNAGSAVSTGGGVVLITTADVDMVGSINAGSGTVSFVPSKGGADVSLGAEGGAGVALHFDGSNDYLQRAQDLDALGTGDFTVELTFTPENLTGNGYLTAMDKSGNASGTIFTIDRFVDKVRFRSKNGSDIISTSTVTIGTTYHVAVVRSGNTFTMYLDGVSLGTLSATGYDFTATTEPLRIGARGDSSAQNPFKGTIDEYRVWNVARTQTEIQNNMGQSLNSTPASLIAYYKLNDGTPSDDNSGLTVVQDSSQSGINATLNGFALTGSSSNFVSDGAVPARLFALDDAELDNVTTTSRIVVGDSNTGDITFNGAIDLANADTLEIVTGGTVNDGGATTVFTDDNLAVTATGGVGTTSVLNIAVSNFEASGGTGGVNVVNTGDLTLGGVSGTLSGVSAANAAISISATSEIIETEPINSDGGPVSLTATSGVTLSGANADVTTGGGTFTVDADSDNNGTGNLAVASAVEATLTPDSATSAGTGSSAASVLVDGNTANAAPRVSGTTGDGSTITLTFNTPQALDEIVIHNGFNAPGQEISQFDIEFFDSGMTQIGATQTLMVPGVNGNAEIAAFGRVSNISSVQLSNIVGRVNSWEVREIQFNRIGVGSVAAGAGNVSIMAVDVAFGGPVTGTGTLKITPSQTASTIGIGGGTGTLNLSDDDLANLTDGFNSITIGDAAAGTGTVSVASSTFNDDVTIVGGRVRVTELNAGSNAVELIARTSTVDDAGDTGLDVTAASLAATAVVGVGPSSNALETAVSNLEADGGTGGVNVANNGDLTLGGASGTLTGVSATNAAISISAASSIIETEPINSGGGPVSLTATSGVTLSGADADVTTGGGTFTVDADSDNNGTGIYSQDDAGSAVSTSGGTVSLTAADVGLTGTIDAGSATVTMVQSRNGAPIDLFAGGDPSLNFGTAAIGAGATVSLTAVDFDVLGNVYILGQIEGTGDFDPSAGIHSLTSNGLRDPFLLKLDSQGNFVWANNWGGTTNDVPRGLSVSDAGDVTVSYEIGSINGFDADPGAGVTTITVVDIAQGVSRFDTDGNFVFGKAFAPANNSSSVEPVTGGLTVDSAGNILLGGKFGGTADFDPGNGTQNLTTIGGGKNGYLAKLDSDGDFVFVKQFGGATVSDAGTHTVDAAGNIYRVRDRVLILRGRARGRS